MQQGMREETWNKIRKNLNRNDLDEQLAWTDNDDVNGHARIVEHGHTGKGPKGWARSDEQIKEEVSEALYLDSQIDASEIEVSVEDGIVSLTGYVDQRQTKRLAEECVEKISGVRDVHNQLRLS